MLTDIAARNAKPSAKPYKLADSQGLYLLVTPAGKYWRMDYRYMNKRKTLAIGVYPTVTLAEARKKRDEAKALLKQDVDPATAKQAQRLANRSAHENTFQAIALEWHAKQSIIWAESTAHNIKRYLEIDLFPWLGNRPIKEITSPEILDVLRKIEGREAHEKAQRTREYAGRVFRHTNRTLCSRIAASATYSGRRWIQGQPFAKAVEELLGAKVQITKRSELHTFTVMPQRWIVEHSLFYLAEKMPTTMEKLRVKTQHQFAVDTFGLLGSPA